jgi:hypothetical protein
LIVVGKQDSMKATIVGWRIKMPKYLVSWKEEDWYNVIIEADSAYEAQDKFWGREYDPEDTVHVGSEVSGSIDIEAITVYTDTDSN